MKRTALTVAASDSSAGAGIQADLRAFSIFGVHGYSVITCLTTQTPDEVISIVPLDVEVVKEQVEDILSKVKPDAIKIGMIYDKDILNYIADTIEDKNLDPVIADPVFRASDGTMLCRDGYIDYYKKRILPLAYLLTPNLDEARIIAGVDANQEDLMRLLHRSGVRNILLKGGHMKGRDAIDILFDGKRFYRFWLPRISRQRWHGTGCVFSSLITASLAKGRNLKRSIDLAKRILWSMMLNSYLLKGSKVRVLGKPDEFDIPPEYIDKERFDVWFSLNRAVRKLIKIIPEDLIPEVGINIGYAVKNAKRKEDICALEGRITKSKTHGNLRFGASKHIASVILTIMRYDLSKRSAMNIKYSDDIVKRFEKRGYLISSFDRKREPAEEKSTMEWGTRKAIEDIGGIPDVVFDLGSHGKEPMIRIIGKDPFDVLTKIREIL